MVSTGDLASVRNSAVFVIAMGVSARRELTVVVLEIQKNKQFVFVGFLLGEICRGSGSAKISRGLADWISFYHFDRWTCVFRQDFRSEIRQQIIHVPVFGFRYWINNRFVSSD